MGLHDGFGFLGVYISVYIGNFPFSRGSLRLGVLVSETRSVIIFTHICHFAAVSCELGCRHLATMVHVNQHQCKIYVRCKYSRF